MQQGEYEKLYKFENFYWWHVGRREILKTFLQRFLEKKENKILEIGCGTGGNLKILSEFGNVFGLDNSKEALSFCGERGFTNLILNKADQTHLPSESFDLVAALDVLEHVEDDEKTAREVWRVLKNGGLFLATVPAYAFLWSRHDELVRHRQRYSLPEFSKKLKTAGFDVIKISHIIFFIFPAILLFRIIEKIFFGKNKKSTAYVMLPKFLNKFFIYLLKLESILLRYFNLPFGTSIIIIAKKK